LSDARCAIGELRTTSIHPENLVEVVQEEINRFRATTQIACVAELALLSGIPGPSCEHVLRTITEGLTNVARHAHAHEVHVCATERKNILTIEVRDDGIGFDPANAEMQIGRYGLLGIRERAKLIEGHLEIQSTSGMGTTLRLHIPISLVQEQEGESACLIPFGSLSPTII
jgi:NarL family two-component system sensor histidine kinase YdfH